ncbi:MAG: hypothetical protein HOY79_19205 [Streptomyces sp.]|nr:hypothetical protein [Streptomyces sp.]NUS29123.1 hypothetical protein [Streptomyces sp.]
MSDYCRRQLDVSGIVWGVCGGPDGCGHLLALHVGVDHCPVCELVDLAARHREPPQTVTVNVQGSLTEKDVLDIMRRALGRIANRSL